MIIIKFITQAQSQLLHMGLLSRMRHTLRRLLGGGADTDQRLAMRRNHSLRVSDHQVLVGVYGVVLGCVVCMVGCVGCMVGCMVCVCVRESDTVRTSCVCKHTPSCTQEEVVIVRAGDSMTYQSTDGSRKTTSTRTAAVCWANKTHHVHPLPTTHTSAPSFQENTEFPARGASVSFITIINLVPTLLPAAWQQFCCAGVQETAYPSTSRLASVVLCRRQHCAWCGVSAGGR